MDKTDRCPATNREGEQCGHPEGWGTENESGPCKYHGGASTGAPEENTNAITHGAYAEANTYYQSVLDDRLREFVDEMFADYLEHYRELHDEPALGLKAELFRISVSHAKDIGLERWAEEKPTEAKSGHPLVDRETEREFNPEDGAVTIQNYKESVVLTAQKRLSNDRRMWLKDLGLLEDPESQTAESQAEMADALRGVLK